MSLVSPLIREMLDKESWSIRREGILLSPREIGDLHFGTHSIDLTLHSTIYRVEPEPAFPFGKAGADFSAIDPRRENSLVFEKLSCDHPLTLKPGELYLGAVREAVDCSAPLVEEGRYFGIFPWKKETYFHPAVEGRSGLARMGMRVHNCAANGRYGFAGYFTLEITVQKPLVVLCGMRVAQLSFLELFGKPKSVEGSYAQLAPGPTLPKTGGEYYF